MEGEVGVARKSSHMLKVGMVVIIDGREQKITAIEKNEETRRVVITCGENIYRRTFGAKIELVSRGR